VGRGHRAGKVILQTYSPESRLLQDILNSDWDAFYKREIQERKTFLFPPFCYLLKLTCRRVKSANAQKAAEKFASNLQKASLGIIIEGPSPAFHEKIQNKFQWQLVIKSKKRNELLKVLQLLPSGWSYDIDPMDLL
jgi:primosomal protein N' (replication factor Y)